MVAQHNQLKTSSVGEKGKGRYTFPGVIKPDWQLPKQLKLMPFVGVRCGRGTDGYSIFGRLEGSPVSPANWKEPPHRAFVNLPCKTTSVAEMEMLDPNAMLAFSKRYGFLHHVSKKSDQHTRGNYGWRIEHAVHLKEDDDCLMAVEGDRNLGSISERISAYDPHLLFQDPTVPWSQAILKYAWQANDRRLLDELSKRASRGLSCHQSFETGEVIITVKSIWTLICMLLIRDHAAGRTAVCANPECPAPYFLKSRKTQKICEAGECVGWAQRNYARKWWRENESKASKETPKGKAK